MLLLHRWSWSLYNGSHLTPQQRYTCTPFHICHPDVGGEYPTIDECEKVCHPPPSSPFDWLDEMDSYDPDSDSPSQIAREEEAEARYETAAKSVTAAGPIETRAVEQADNSMPGKVFLHSTRYHICYDDFVSCNKAAPGGSPMQNDDVIELTGTINATGGQILVHSVGGTFPDTTIGFDTPTTFPMPGCKDCPRIWNSDVSGTFKGTLFTGQAQLDVHHTPFGNYADLLKQIKWSASGHNDWTAYWVEGGPPPPPPAHGQCTLYKTVASNTTANSTTFSAIGKPPTVALWPSWPASSPWVTAVGATTFIGQHVGKDEMATDQFGSGGGFSRLFDELPNATWQSAAVAKYLSSVDPASLPPANSFPATGDKQN